MQAATYYVSTSGVNTNPGTFTLPWRTISKASSTAAAGSLIYIRGGVYNEKVSVDISGTVNNFITYQSYPSEQAIIDGTGFTNGNLFEIYNKNYIKLIDIEFRNFIVNQRAALLIEFGSTNIEIRNCQIHDIFFSSDPNAPVGNNTNINPLLVYGDNPNKVSKNIVVDNCEIWNCRTGFSEALTMDGNVSNFTISNNKVHDISNIGIDMAGHFGASSNPSNDQARNGICTGNLVYNCISPYANAAGIYVDGGKSIVIEKNIIYGCQWGIEVGCENIGKTSSQITVRNNFIYNNQSSGLAFGGYDYPNNSGRITSCKFLNNSLYQNDINTSSQDLGEVTITATQNCQFKNNIIYSGAENYLITLDASAGNLVLDYNNYFTVGGINNAIFNWNGIEYNNFSGYKTGSGKDVNSFFGDPTFSNPSVGDLHLGLGSIAINGGDVNFVAASNEKDIDNQNRVFGTIVDIGADESNILGLIVQENNLQQQIIESKHSESKAIVYPNPINQSVSIINKKVKKVIILDATGKVKIEKNFENTETFITIQLTNLPKGIYFLIWQNDLENGVEKLIKND
jgi:Secretion system C-terminal sorting domain/Right handed beta helix region